MDALYTYIRIEKFRHAALLIQLLKLTNL